MIPHFVRWMNKFPSVSSLASSSEEEVTKAWAGLGYYRRARFLRKGAQHIMEKHGGIVPPDVESLLAVPGIGEYTAGAVSSIAFGRQAALVDGNVIRVVSRLAGIVGDPRSPALPKAIWQWARSAVPPPHNGKTGQSTDLQSTGGSKGSSSSSSSAPSPAAGEATDPATGKHPIDASDATTSPRNDPGDFNQGLMELGATVCTPTGPACGRCPLRPVCASRLLEASGSTWRDALDWGSKEKVSQGGKQAGSGASSGAGTGEGEGNGMGNGVGNGMGNGMGTGKEAAADLDGARVKVGLGVVGGIEITDIEDLLGNKIDPEFKFSAGHLPLRKPKTASRVARGAAVVAFRWCESVGQSSGSSSWSSSSSIGCLEVLLETRPSRRGALLAGH